MWSIVTLSAALAFLAPTCVNANGKPFQSPNQVAGTWLLATANTTSNGTTSPAFGDHPVGVLIFAPTLYFSELVSVDPTTLPRFASNSRDTGTPAENAAVVAGTLGQIGRYNISADGSFESERFIASTFPNWIGLFRNTSAINETVSDHGMYIHETLHDPGATTTIDILWWRAV